jgi:1-acyl-sn-glycerol-3-phosphate acyltransferase
MKKQRVIYYSDPLNDDFANNHIKRRPLPDNFKYVHKNPVWKFFSALIYYVLAIPILWLVAKLHYGLKVVGKKKFKRCHLTGYFVYGNHTQDADGFFATVDITAPIKTYIVANQDAVSLRGLRWLIMMLGCLPVPETPKQKENFIAAIEYRIKRGDAVIIMPEAHVWPYCTRIRPFPDSPFTYPAQLLAPVVPLCTTYEQRKFFKNLPPRPVIHIGDPVYPDSTLPLGERAHQLREACYNYMEDVSSSFDNYEYVRYFRKKGAPNK